MRRRDEEDVDKDGVVVFHQMRVGGSPLSLLGFGWNSHELLANLIRVDENRAIAVLFSPCPTERTIYIWQPISAGQKSFDCHLRGFTGFQRKTFVVEATANAAYASQATCSFTVIGAGLQRFSI